MRFNELIPDYGSYDIEREASALKKFLQDHDMRIPLSFFSQIRQGDVIDLYTNPPDMRQLFCNDEFKKLCSYSETQMQTLPFTKLFWRSDEIQHQLIRRATEIAMHSNEAEKWNIENHELIESLHPQKRTFEIDLGSAAPCFDIKTGGRVGFVSSLRVKLIFEWPDFKLPE